jgi:hypothetical protein
VIIPGTSSVLPDTWQVRQLVSRRMSGLPPAGLALESADEDAVTGDVTI